MSRCQLTLVAKILHNIWYNHDAFEKTLVLITYAGTYTVTPPISRDNAYSIYTLRHFNIYIYILYNYNSRTYSASCTFISYTWFVLFVFITNFALILHDLLYVSYKWCIWYDYLQCWWYKSNLLWVMFDTLFNCRTH